MGVEQIIFDPAPRDILPYKSGPHPHPLRNKILCEGGT